MPNSSREVTHWVPKAPIQFTNYYPCRKIHCATFEENDTSEAMRSRSDANRHSITHGCATLEFHFSGAIAWSAYTWWSGGLYMQQFWYHMLLCIHEMGFRDSDQQIMCRYHNGAEEAHKHNILQLTSCAFAKEQSSLKVQMHRIIKYLSRGFRFLH